MTVSRRVRPVSQAVIVCFLALLSAPLPAHALVGVAEGELFLRLDGTIARDSNISSNASETSDTIYTVTPGFEWLRQRGRANISLSGECGIERAMDNDYYNSENYSAAFSISMPATASGRLQGSFDASYFDGSRVNAFQNTRTAESSFDLGTNATYQATGRINVRAGAAYGETDPDNTAGYANRSLSAGLGYNIRPMLSVYLDGRSTSSSSDFSEAIGDETHTKGKALLVGLDGQITSKISGHAGIGYDWSDNTRSGFRQKYSGATYDVALTWAPRERTSFALNASNGVQATSTGATKFSRVSLTASQQIGLHFSAQAGVNFRSSEFSSAARGDDDVTGFNLNVRYALTQNISLAGGYNYTKNDSTNAQVDYTRSVVSFSVTSRF